MKRLIIFLLVSILAIAVGDAYAQRSKKNSGRKRPKTTKVVKGKKKSEETGSAEGRCPETTTRGES